MLFRSGTPLDPTVASAVTAVAAEHGDARLFDALIAASARAASPDEQYRYLFALGRFRDPALVDRGLARVLTDDIRSQDAAIYLDQFLVNPAVHERAWSFVKEHWTALAPKVTISGGDTNLVHALGSFCDAAARDDVAAFFKAHPLPGATRTLEQTIEQINLCIAFRTRATPEVTRWLDAH